MSKTQGDCTLKHKEVLPFIYYDGTNKTEVVQLMEDFCGKLREDSLELSPDYYYVYRSEIQTFVRYTPFQFKVYFDVLGEEE